MAFQAPVLLLCAAGMRKQGHVNDPFLSFCHMRAIRSERLMVLSEILTVSPMHTVLLLQYYERRKSTCMTAPLDVSTDTRRDFVALDK